MENLQESISQRIKLVIDQFANGVQRQFANEIGVTPTAVSEILGKRKNMPSVGLLQKIVSTYSQLRTEWLLTGEGPMLKKGDPSDRHFMDDVFDEMIRPRAKDKILPHTNDEIAERPNPEPEWRSELTMRLDDMRKDAISAHKNPLRLQELVREAYEIILPEILDKHASDIMPHWFAIELTKGWNYPFMANAAAAWSIIRSNFIALYPQFPFLQYFLDFADPHKRIAVFIEEPELLWSPESIDYQDKILIVHGWKIFRVPSSVAKTYESDVLPTHLKDAYTAIVEGRASTQVIEERRERHQQLGRTTIDGFFRWLKLEYFLEDKL